MNDVRDYLALRTCLREWDNTTYKLGSHDCWELVEYAFTILNVNRNNISGPLYEPYQAYDVFSSLLAPRNNGHTHCGYTPINRRNWLAGLSFPWQAEYYLGDVRSAKTMLTGWNPFRTGYDYVAAHAAEMPPPAPPDPIPNFLDERKCCVVM